MTKLNTIKAISLFESIYIVIVEGVDNFKKKHESWGEKQYKNRKLNFLRRPEHCLTETVASGCKQAGALAVFKAEGRSFDRGLYLACG